jgi:hypothetical protein
VRSRLMLDVGPDRLSYRGEPKIVVAAQFGVSRQTLHTWLTRGMPKGGLAGLMDPVAPIPVVFTPSQCGGRDAGL